MKRELSPKIGATDEMTETVKTDRKHIGIDMAAIVSLK